MISKRVEGIEVSGVRRMFELASKVKDPINLTIGQPDYDIPSFIKDKAIEAINSGFNKYTKTSGIDELIEKVREYYRDRKQVILDGKDIIITSGVSGGLSLVFFSLLDPGDEVLIPDPYFVSYKELTTLVGGKPVFVDTYPHFRLNGDILKEYITDKTKFLILNSPNNPTGVVLKEDELKSIVEVADKYGLYIVSDEIYDYFSYDGEAISIGRYYDKVIVLNGFSKNASFTGWRVGYLIADKDLIEAFIKVQQYTFVCAPSFAQKAAVYVFSDEFDSDFSKHFDEYRRKRDLIKDYLGDIDGFVLPEGAFYSFIPVAGYSSSDFVEKMAKEYSLLVVSGDIFSQKNTHIRISFSGDYESLEKGLSILAKELKK